MNKFAKLATAIAAVAVVAAFSAPTVYAQNAPAAEMVDGEVRKIDLESGKVTLKHGEIKSLDMPGMTMVFTVKDKALLDKVKTGDKVRFKAVKDEGKFTVTEIQPAR